MDAQKRPGCSHGDDAGDDGDATFIEVVLCTNRKSWVASLVLDGNMKNALLFLVDMFHSQMPIDTYVPLPC